MSEDKYQGVKIQLGEVVYSSLDVSKTELGLLADGNKVYVDGANNGVLSDKLKFSYDPNKKFVTVGKVKVIPDSSTNSGAITYKNISFKAYEVGASDGDSGGDSGEVVTGDYVERIIGGAGIKVDSSNSRRPIVSLDGTSTGWSVNLDSPDYYALLDLLEVMQVSYDDEASETLNLCEETDATREVTGLRFVYGSADQQEKMFNCIRIKNDSLTNQNGTDIFLKVIMSDSEFDDSVLGETDTHLYGDVSEKIYTVSSNFVNQSDDTEWYEWYFPKNVILKQDYEYVIIPHHDKNYDVITESSSKLKLKTGAVNTSNNCNGVWTAANRTETIDISCTPAIQFCNKKPTTITMIQ